MKKKLMLIAFLATFTAGTVFGRLIYFGYDPADINHDHKVTEADFSAFQYYFYKDNPTWRAYTLAAEQAEKQ